jgi:hypothetical protein
MTTAAFDTHAAVKQLRAAGVDDAQAETLVDIMSRALGDPVTKADIEPLATKEFVRAEISRVDTRIAGLRVEVQSQITGLHAEMQSQIAGVDGRITGLHTEMQSQIAGVDGRITGLHAKIAGVRTEIAHLEARLFRHLWVMAIGIVGATFTLLKLFP